MNTSIKASITASKQSIVYNTPLFPQLSMVQLWQQIHRYERLLETATGIARQVYMNNLSLSEMALMQRVDREF
ncbi:hypothetical protein AB4304_13895 [Vibrio breoganii]